MLMPIFAIPFGIVAQLVEQRTENPCVDGSIPPDTTTNKWKRLITNRLRGVFHALLSVLLSVLPILSIELCQYYFDTDNRIGISRQDFKKLPLF